MSDPKLLNKTTKKALNDVAKRISGNKEITLRFSGTYDVTDGQKITIRRDAEKNLRLSQGLVAHEAGHIGYGSLGNIIKELVFHLTNKYKLDEETARSLMNMVEDARVNKINNRVFPGFYRSLREWFYMNVLPEIRQQSFHPLLRDIGLYFEDFDWTFNNAEHKLNDEQLDLIETAKLISDKFISPASSVFICKLLAELFKKKQEEEGGKKQRPSPSPSADARTDPSASQKIYDPNFKKSQEYKDDYKFMQDMNKMLDEEFKKLIEQLLKLEACENEDNKECEGSIQRMRDFLEEQERKLSKYIQEVMVTRRPYRKIERRYYCRKARDLEKYPPTALEIMSEYKREIETLKRYLNLLEKKSVKKQKFGRLNNDWMKAIVGDYEKCFSRKRYERLQRLTLLIDISGSMTGPMDEGDYERCHKESRRHLSKLSVAKICSVIFGEIFKDFCDLRIVLFTGVKDVVHHVIKDFKDTVHPRDYDEFGYDQMQGENLDGLSLIYEAEKIGSDGIIIIVSDGYPAGDYYSLGDAITDVNRARKLCKFIFAFSIKARGDYLTDMYEKHFIIVKDKEEFREKLLKFGRILMEQYLR